MGTTLEIRHIGGNSIYGSLNGRRQVLVREPLVRDALHANNMVQRIPVEVRSPIG